MAIRRITFKKAIAFLNSNPEGGMMPLNTLGHHFLEVLPTGCDLMVELVAHTDSRTRLVRVPLDMWDGDLLDQRGNLVNKESDDVVTRVLLHRGEVAIYNCGRLEKEDPKLTLAQRRLGIRIELTEDVPSEVVDTRKGASPNSFGRYTQVHGHVIVPLHKGVALEEFNAPKGAGNWEYYSQTVVLCKESALDWVLAHVKELKPMLQAPDMGYGSKLLAYLRTHMGNEVL